MSIRITVHLINQNVLLLIRLSNRQLIVIYFPIFVYYNMRVVQSNITIVAYRRLFNTIIIRKKRQIVVDGKY